jgi:bacterioferritin (cytochrome b1)
MKNRDKKLSALRARAQEWYKLYPHGEPLFNKDGKGLVLLEAKQVAAILEIYLRTAQQQLQDLREVLGKNRNDYVSVKEFCFLYQHEEEDFKKALEYLS